MKRLATVALYLLLFGGAGCSSEDDTRQGELRGDFVVQALVVDGKAVSLEPLGPPATVYLSVSGIEGEMGCNGYSGTRSNAGPLFSDLQSSAMSCGRASDVVSQAVFQSLFEVDAYEYTDGGLTLKGPDVTITLRND